MFPTRWLYILLSLSFSVLSEESSICAEVKIQISQELTIERQGFEGTLEIENVLADRSLENIAVDLTFTDDTGASVKASSNPNSSDAKFFIRVISQDNIDDTSGAGTLAPKQKANVTWLIVPVPGTGGDKVSGKLYWVGATFKYSLDGIEESIPVEPDTIFVRPMPKLTLDYFLPEVIYSDDPFTPEIEPPEPFHLGVLVNNSGKGLAKSVKIDSAQPEIIENTQGLKIAFKLTGAQVDNQPIDPSLLINFGDIESGKTKVGRWTMETSLSGKFKNFSASFSHDSELGGSLTSLLEAVNTHTLVSNVLADSPGHDDIEDFLADDEGNLKLYDTLGNVSPVALFPENLSLIAQNRYQVSVNGKQAPRLIKSPSPDNRNVHPTKVTRSDGKNINVKNVWVSKTQDVQTREFTYFVNIFDIDTGHKYFLEYSDQVTESVPPVFAPTNLIIAIQGEPVIVTFSAQDKDADPLSFSAQGLPTGAVLKDLGNGTANLTWTPTLSQLGKASATLSVSDGTHEVIQPIFFDIRSNDDRDGDGLSDAWEMEKFGSLEQDPHGDFDGDGLTNQEEFDLGKDPSIPDGPGEPEIITPVSEEVTSLAPELIIRNSLYDGPHSIVYEYEIYLDDGYSQLVDAYYSVVQSAEGVTSWKPSLPLIENTHYFWRVRANNNFIKSLWKHGQFFVNAINERPSVPGLIAPENNGELAPNELSFTLISSHDPDEDTLSYQIKIYDDIAMSNLVASSPQLLSDDNGQVFWEPAQALIPDTTYYWTAEALDDENLTSQSLYASFSLVNNNQAPIAPVLLSPANNERTPTNTPLLKFQAGVDPDSDPISHLLQIDRSDTFDTAEMIEIKLSANVSEHQYQLGQLIENEFYFWRVKSIDTHGASSSWSVSSFFVNAENSVPEQPTNKNPGDNAWVSSLTPQLAVHEVTDIDLDSVTYEFAVYDASKSLELIWSGASDTPDAIPSTALRDNTWYFWHARAVDEKGLASNWSPQQSFFTDENDTNDTPTLVWTNSEKPHIVSGQKNIKLTWEDTDPDSSALISIYYQKEGTSEKTYIGENIPEDKDGKLDKLVWKAKGLEDGTYRIFAVISDEETSETIEAPFIVVASKKYISQGSVKPHGGIYKRIVENGEPGEASFVLSKAPYTQVVVKIEGIGPGISLSNDTLVFSPDNWNTPQSITFSVEDDCQFRWYHPLELKPTIPNKTDPAYQSSWYPSILGHVVNDEPRTAFSKYLDICSFQKVSSESSGSKYKQTYNVTVKSKHDVILENLNLEASTWSPLTKLIDNNIHIPLLGANEVRLISDEIVMETVADSYFPAHHFNWKLQKQATQP